MPAGKVGTYADSINRYKQFAQAMSQPTAARPAPPQKKKPTVSRVVTPEELLGRPAPNAAKKKK